VVGGWSPGWTGLQEVRGQRGGGSVYVLAVVEEEERGTGIQVPRNGLEQSVARRLTHPESGRDGLRHKLLVFDRRKLNEVDTGSVLAGSVGGHFERETRLANATGADESDDTSGTH
jgi:hypothetical protein